jgi:hypothetical protein
MTILDRHNGYDDIISSWAVWGGHISNPMWQPRGRHCDDFELVVNENQPGPSQLSIWAKPNRWAYFIIIFSLFWSAKWAKPNIWPFSFPSVGLFTTFVFYFRSIECKASRTCQLGPTSQIVPQTGPTHQESSKCKLLIRSGSRWSNFHSQCQSTYMISISNKTDEIHQIILKFVYYNI